MKPNNTLNRQFFFSVIISFFFIVDSIVIKNVYLLTRIYEYYVQLLIMRVLTI